MEDYSLDDVPPREVIFKKFEGRYVDAMPALMAEKRIPMPVSALMKRRLQVLKSKNDDLISNWWGNYFDSPDGIANFKQEYKIVKNAEPLLSINKKSKLQNGALVLTEKQYDALKGETFSRKELEKAGINDWMPKDKVIAHPVWQVIAGSEDEAEQSPANVASQHLLKNYANAQFKKYNNTKTMGVYVTSPQDIPNMRAWVLNGGDGRSGLDGDRDLAYDYARLVGVRKNKTEQSSANVPSEQILEELLL